MKRLISAIALMALMALPTALSPDPAVAGMADVVAAEAAPAAALGDETFYRFTVTVRHADEGWDHYADNFEILAPDGAVLGTRVLAHPHENEQPFTRSLDAVAVPGGIAEVTIRAHDSVHGNGGETVTITLPTQ
jgi:hypothetical protein